MKTERPRFRLSCTTAFTSGSRWDTFAANRWSRELQISCDRYLLRGEGVPSPLQKAGYPAYSRSADHASFWDPLRWAVRFPCRRVERRS
jgi:hypothetical protein